MYLFNNNLKNEMNFTLTTVIWFSVLNFSFCKKYFLSLFIYLFFERERERERERAGEGQRERERENPKEAPHFQQRA